MSEFFLKKIEEGEMYNPMYLTAFLPGRRRRPQFLSSLTTLTRQSREPNYHINCDIMGAPASADAGTVFLKVCTSCRSLSLNATIFVAKRIALRCYVLDSKDVIDLISIAVESLILFFASVHCSYR